MTDLQTLAKYPFLSEAKDYVKENKISVKELLDNPLYERARVIGIERLDNAFSKKDVQNRSLGTETDSLMELLSYPISRMIAVCVGDNYFKRRYALGEAVNTYKNLQNEDISFILNVAKEFKIRVYYFEDSGRISIYFTDYLHYAPTRYKEWKMINRDMKNGFIIINPKELSRIIQEALRERINQELDIHECNQKIYNTFKSDIQRIQNTVMMHRKKIEAVPVGRLDVKKLPPCMKDILSSIQNGENVSHVGRFAIVSFLNSLQLSTNDIIKLFSSAPDFEEEKTRYQIDHIKGNTSSTSYRPPGCDKMRTYGVCPVDKMDALCRKVRHPSNYYKAKWRMEKKKK